MTTEENSENQLGKSPESQKVNNGYSTKKILQIGSLILVFIGAVTGIYILGKSSSNESYESEIKILKSNKQRDSLALVKQIDTLQKSIDYLSIADEMEYYAVDSVIKENLGKLADDIYTGERIRKKQSLPSIELEKGYYLGLVHSLYMYDLKKGRTARYHMRSDFKNATGGFYHRTYDEILERMEPHQIAAE